jgi:glycosyltransferase involved in cell wall biosynthesis
MANHSYDLSLVIACYNEEAFLLENFQQILEFLEETCWTFEIIFVDDQSADDTRRIIEAIIEKYPQIPIRRIYHTRNCGRGRTVNDGIRISRGKVVGYIDIDLEVRAQNIIPMLVAIKNGADVALAERVYKIQPTSIHRHFLSVGYRLIRNFLLGLPLGDTEAGYKFFNREKILPIIEACQDPGWFWDTEIIVRAHFNGLKIIQIPCLFIRHPSKKSTVRILPDTLDYIIKLIRFRSIMKQFNRPEIS